MEVSGRGRRKEGKWEVNQRNEGRKGVYVKVYDGLIKVHEHLLYL